ncbi:MAG TPA: hypothetical protein VF762_05460 [Blastocatellia bacterium]|jgi:hypothetical protein
MKTDDLENELRNLKLIHLTESDLVAYCDQQLNRIRLARAEAHLKQCFICERRLALLREENAALNNQEFTANDVALVDRLIERTGLAQEPAAAKPLETVIPGPMQERLAECLREIVTGLRIFFMREPVPRAAGQGEEVWRWESEDGRLQSRAIMEKNSDLTIHFSSSEIDLEGARLNVRLGQMSQEITLRRISESEVHAKVAVPWQYRKRNMADISIENV